MQTRERIAMGLTVGALIAWGATFAVMAQPIVPTPPALPSVPTCDAGMALQWDQPATAPSIYIVSFGLHPTGLMVRRYTQSPFLPCNEIRLPPGQWFWSVVGADELGEQTLPAPGIAIRVPDSVRLPPLTGLRVGGIP